MKKQEFMTLFRFHEKWLSAGLYPDELFSLQLAGYEPGHENASEHDRNGAFHWWIRRNPDKQQLADLLELTFLGADHFMDEDARRYLCACDNFDEDHAALVEELDKKYPAPPPYHPGTH